MLPQILSMNPLLLIFLQATIQKICHFRRYGSLLLNHILLIQHIILDFRLIPANKIALPKQNLMRDHTQRPHINLRPVFLSAKELRGHVGIGADLLFVPGGIDCKAEVADLVQ
jgi:hypothetical protein